LSLLVREREDELTHHVARKKIPVLSEDGQLEKPTDNNGQLHCVSSTVTYLMGMDEYRREAGEVCV
jgi:hypothetical protein